MFVILHFQKYDRYNFWKYIYTVQKGIWNLPKLKWHIGKALPVQ